MSHSPFAPLRPRFAAILFCLPLFVTLLPRLQTGGPAVPAQPQRQIAYIVRGAIDAPGEVNNILGDIWLVNEDGTDARQLTNTGRDCCLAWSPDGARLFFARQADVPADQIQYFTLFQVDISTGAVQEVSPILDGSAGSLATSTDGALLAYTTDRPISPEPFGILDNRGCLHTLDMATGETMTIDCVEEGLLREPEFNPNEPRIVVTLSGMEVAAILSYPLSPAEPTFYQEACCLSAQLAANDIRLYAIATSYYMPATFEDNALDGTIGIFEYGQGLHGATPVLVGDDRLGELDLSPEENRLAYTRNGTIEIVELWTDNPPVAVVAGSDPAWRPGQALDPVTPSPTAAPPTTEPPILAAEPEPTIAGNTSPTGETGGPTEPAAVVAATVVQQAALPEETNPMPGWLGPARAAALGVMVVSGGALAVGLVALALRRRGA